MDITKSGNFSEKRSSEFVGNFFKLAVFGGLVFSCEENARAMFKMEQNEVEKNEKIANERKNTGAFFSGTFPKEIDDEILSFLPKKEKYEMQSIEKNIEFQEIVRFFHNSNACGLENTEIKFISKKDRENAFNLTRKELKMRIEEGCYVGLNTFADKNSSINLNKNQKKLEDFPVKQFFKSQAEFLFALFFDQKTEGCEYKQLMPLRLSVSKEEDFSKVEKLLNFVQKKLNSVKKNEKILENDDLFSFAFGIKLDFEIDAKFLQKNEFVKKYKKNNISSLKFKDSICNQDLKTFIEMDFIGLINLNLCNCKLITNAGLKYLKDLVNLRELNLYKCYEITDAGLAYLKGLVNLRELNLSGCNKITDAGLDHLKKLKNLQRLNLRYCQKITGKGFEHLKGLVNLRELDLWGCYQITDAGLAHLSGLVNLRNLNLWGCAKITDDGKEMLKKAIPGIHIEM